MKNKFNTPIKQAKVSILWLGFLLLVSGQAFAQQATTIEVIKQSFDTYGFTDNYVVSKPNYPGLEFLNNINFTYNTQPDGQMAGIDGACIITKNSCKVGHGTDCQWPHPDHTGDGYYLFAVGPPGMQNAEPSAERTVYFVTVPVQAGETVKFVVWTKSVATGYNMRIDATGTGLDNKTTTTGMFSTDSGNWIQRTLITMATKTGNITFSVIDMYGYSDNQHKFGLDDITVTKKAINITSPLSLSTTATLEGSPAIEAQYYNPSQSGNLSYRWQRSENGTTWTTATGTGNTGIVSPSSSSIPLTFNPTETTEGYVFYRLIFSNDNFTTIAINSDRVTVEYSQTEYIFKEDFGGNFLSTASPDQTGVGASGDWWLMPDDQPAIKTDFSYGPVDNPIYDNRIYAEKAYGQIPIKLDESNPTYAITKMAGWSMPLPGTSEVWYWGANGAGNEDGKKKGKFDDHTIPGDDSRGYFMYATNSTNSPKIVYETSIPVKTDMKGKNLTFSTWQVALWGSSIDFNESYGGQYRLTVLNNSGGEIIRKTFGVSDAWEERKLAFDIPSSYTGNITLRISAIGNNLWLGLDDITLVETPPVSVLTPTDGEIICQDQWPFVSFDYLASNAVQYQWQYSSDGESGWTELETGSLPFTGNTDGFSFFINEKGTGYYRLGVTLVADDYSAANAEFSKSIHLTMKNRIDVDKITFTPTHISPDYTGSIMATYADPLINPTYLWKESLYWTTLGETNMYTITTAFGAGIPASGTVDYFHLDLESNDYCWTGKFVPIVNNRMKEDFKTGTNPRLKKDDALKAYVIPGLDYLIDDETLMLENTYTFTKGTVSFPNGVNISGYGGSGYFLQVSAAKHDAESSPREFYKTTLETLCAGAKYSFTAQIANLVPQTNHKLQFRFRVKLQEVDSNGTIIENGENREISYLTDGKAIYNANWEKNGFEFMVPGGKDQYFNAICTIESAGYLWTLDGKNFGLDEVNIERKSPAQIIIPATNEIKVLENTSVDIKGIYVSCGTESGSGHIDESNFIWQVSNSGAANSWVDGTSGATTTNEQINTDTVYYRIKVKIAENQYAYSDSLKIIPVKSTSMTGKTYYVCPDNMPDDEIEHGKQSNGKFLPGMPGAPGYLPSLIRMEMEGLYGITYKWYREQTGGIAIDDGDEYDPTQRYENESEIEVPRLLSDDNSNTLSVMNERNTNGIFTMRSYWVEFCDINGKAINGVDRIQIKLEPGYLCGSTDTETLSHPMVSPATARRIYRETFGGTDPGSPNISTTPLDGIDYPIETVDGPDLAEGAYKVVKVAPTLGDGWYTNTHDHIYKNANPSEEHGYMVAINANENPGRFYTYEMEDLAACDDLNFVFTGWFTSPVNWPGLEKANLMFRLTDSNTRLILAEFVTGNMKDKNGDATTGAIWRQFGFTFHLPEGSSNLTLEIINNNFGTAGGNDVLMDDIEIYLNIPPVIQYPEFDSFVCVEDNGETEKTGIGQLSGRYEGNGTFGSNLEYWWEFRKEGTPENAWVREGVIDKDGNKKDFGTEVYTNKDGYASVQSDYIIPGFVSANNGDYRLVVGQEGAYTTSLNYDCLATSNPRKLTFLDNPEFQPTPTFDHTKAENGSTDMNITAYCYDDYEYVSITNFDKESNIQNSETYKTIIWTLDGVTIKTFGEEDDRSEFIAAAKNLQLKLEELTAGFHTVSLTVINSLECERTIKHDFVVFAKTTTWTAEGTTGNWNDAANWSDGVPGDCTDAIIPYKTMDLNDATQENPSGLELLSHYPALLPPTVETLNGTVYTGNQENVLSQKYAKNDDDFSLRPTCDDISFLMGGSVTRTDYLKYNFAYVNLDIIPNQWYMVSAPLGSTYSGDYYMEGHTGRQFPALYMMKYQSENPETGRPALAGDFSNPFNNLDEELYPGLGFTIWADDDTPEGANPVTKLQPLRFPKDSTEYAMYHENGNYVETISGLKRDYLGRFTYEQKISSGLPNTKNSSLTGFDVNMEQDSEEYSTILVGNPFMSHLNYSKFAGANPVIKSGYYTSIWTEDGEIFDATNPEIFPDDSNEIPPMQSFIVSKADNTKVENLRFTFDMAIRATSANNVLRANNQSILKVDVLRDGIAQSNIRLKYDPSESNEYDSRKDMWTLFSETTTYPAVIYAMLDNKAASIRTIGDLSKPIELGIRTDVHGPLTLRFSGFETWNSLSNIYFEDRLTGESRSLEDISEYTFDNNTGNVEGRFFLITKGTNIEEVLPTASEIHIYSDQKEIKVSSSVNDPIQSVKIYSVQGKLLYEKQAIGQSYFSANLPVTPQVIIVAVVTKYNKKTGKVILK